MDVFRVLFIVLLLVCQTGAMDFNYIPETVYLPHVHSTDIVVWNKIEATCKTTINRTEEQDCIPLCDTITLTYDCNRCEVMPNSSHLLYVKDMSIYKKSCATPDCSSTCPGINCISPGETVTVGVRCWMSWQQSVDNRDYSTATFEIVSVSNVNTRYSGCPDLSVDGGQVSTNHTTHCSAVSASCAPGFTLFGEGSLMCCNEIWNVEVPVCLKDCENVSILNGKVSSNLTAHGTEISMSCNGGYSLLGAETMTCSNGSWTEAVPECYKECHNNHFGENCTLPCDCVVNNTLSPDQSCHSFSGVCRCLPSWTGDRCQTKCETGNCGSGGENNEARRMERNTGNDNTELVLPLSLGFGMLGLVLVVAIVTLVCWRRTKKKRSESKRETRQVSITDILQARQTQPPRQESDNDPNYCALNFHNPMSRKADNSPHGCQRTVPSLTIQKGQMEFV